MVTKSRMEIARHSAWRQFGRRHYRWFVYGHLAARAAPWVAGLVTIAAVVWAVNWAWSHINPAALALVAGSGAALVLLGWAGYELASVSAVRKGFTFQRLALGGASSALAFAAFASVMLR